MAPAKAASASSAMRMADEIFMDRVSRISLRQNFRRAAAAKLSRAESIVADRPGGQSVFVPRRSAVRATAARVRHNFITISATDFRRPQYSRTAREKNFAPVNCITLAGYDCAISRPLISLPGGPPSISAGRPARAPLPLPAGQRRTRGVGACRMGLGALALSPPSAASATCWPTILCLTTLCPPQRLLSSAKIKSRGNAACPFSKIISPSSPVQAPASGARSRTDTPARARGSCCSTGRESRG